LEELTQAVQPAQVEQVRNGVFRVIAAQGQDPTDQLLRASLERDWGLYQLSPAQASVEEVFVHLTRQDDVDAGAPENSASVTAT
jgi:hypothetical protein